MANRNLAEVKKVLKTDKVFETETSFLVNDFGKYAPNITFIVRKDFEGNPLTYRSDAPVSGMIAGMNVDFDGETGVIFGDFWRSRKGGACFRPKNIAEVQHVLVRVNWGGAFSKTRGVSLGQGEIYGRTASSNGGGSGYDYLVFPLGFFRVVHDAEIDGDTSTSQPDFGLRAAEVRASITTFDREKLEAQKAAEAANRAAKAGGLGARLEAANIRLSALGQETVVLGEISFKWGWQELPYTEGNVAWLERHIKEAEDKIKKEASDRIARETFESRFNAFASRLEAIGFSIKYGNDCCGFNGHYGNAYSEEGLVTFAASVAEEERKAGEVRRQAAETLRYAELCAEAEGDAENILRDFGGVLHTSQETGRAAFYVICPDGTLRDYTSETWSKSHQRGAHSQYWEIVFPGELALEWGKSSNASPHYFHVHKLPKDTECTEAQLEAVAALEAGLEADWAGRCGFASGLPSPSVGEGWSLQKKQPVFAAASVVSVDQGGTPASANSLEALQKHFGK